MLKFEAVGPLYLGVIIQQMSHLVIFHCRYSLFGMASLTCLGDWQVSGQPLNCSDWWEKYNWITSSRHSHLITGRKIKKNIINPIINNGQQISIFDIWFFNHGLFRWAEGRWYWSIGSNSAGELQWTPKKRPCDWSVWLGLRGGIERIANKTLLETWGLQAALWLLSMTRGVIERVTK